MNRDIQSGQTRPTVTLLASMSLVAATPPAVYFVFGDQSEAGLPYYLDYFWKAPAWSDTTVNVVGVTALITIAISILTVARERHHHRASGAALAIDCLLVAAGALTVWSYRIMIAGVNGANIGAGLIILSRTPIVLWLLVSAVVIAIRSRTHTAEFR